VAHLVTSDEGTLQFVEDIIVVSNAGEDVYVWSPSKPSHTESKQGHPK
jgi:hypothetical protein